MDSVSHIRVANLLMDYVEQTCGVTFDQSGFIYGNLKPDLTGTYLTKRHNALLRASIPSGVPTDASCRSISARSATT